MPNPADGSRQVEGVEISRRPGPRVGINLDQTLAADASSLIALGVAAVGLRFDQLWIAARSHDPFEIAETIDREVRRAGFDPVELGIPVIPIGSWPSPLDLAAAVARLATTTENRFSFGVGVGHPSVEPSRYRARDLRPVSYLREYLVALKAILSGEPVTRSNAFLELSDASLESLPPRPRIYVGALGPAMLRMGGELAEGVVLNWATPNHIEWSRARIAEGTHRAGRREGISVVTQVRVCISQDASLARLVLARQLVSMTLRSPIERADRGYRAHMGRLGHADLFSELVDMKEGGATRDELAQRIPGSIVDSLAYAGPAEGARAAICRLSEGADAVIVRVVPADDDDLGAVRRAITACAPMGRAGDLQS